MLNYYSKINQLQNSMVLISDVKVTISGDYISVVIGQSSTAVAVPLLWRMRLSCTKISAILMTSLRLALALTPAAQDDKRGEKNKYRTNRSSAH